MSGLNKVQLIGNLGQDPDVRYTNDGRPIANVSIATNESWKDKSGVKQERVEWHRVVFFGRLAEVVAEYLQKGAKIYVEGRIQSKKYQTKGGEERTAYEIIASEMLMLDGVQSAATGPNTRSSAPRKRSSAPKQESIPMGGGDPLDDDIPFAPAVYV